MNTPDGIRGQRYDSADSPSGNIMKRHRPHAIGSPDFARFHASGPAKMRTLDTSPATIALITVSANWRQLCGS